MAWRPKPWFREERNSWFVTIGGTQHNLGPDKREAFDRFYRLMRQPQPKKVAAELLAGIADAFLEWVEKHRAADTYEWYRYRLQRFVERHPTLRLGDLRPFHVQKWVDSYSNFSRTSRRNYVRAVKRCLHWAMQQGYIESNPISQMEVSGAERRETVVTAGMYEELLTHVRDTAFRNLLVVTWETGCRPQESLRVEARHVDDARQRWVFPQQESKGKRSPRIVYMTDPAMEIVRALVAKFPTGKLFRNINGDPWTTEAVNCVFDRLQIRMGKELMRESGEAIKDAAIAAFIPSLCPTRLLRGTATKKSPAILREEAKRKLTQRRAKQLAPRYSLYSLRHAWATRALQSGLDGLTVAILMGHSDPSTLARVYQHLAHDPQHLLKQAKRATS